MVATLNAAKVLDATARMLGVDHDTLSDLALSAPAGAGGLVYIPYLEGERTPNLPTATGALHGMRLANSTAAHVARAAVEGVLCGLRAGLEALVAQGVEVGRVVLIGGVPACRRCGRARRRSWGTPCPCPRPASTSPTAPRGKPRGFCRVPSSRRTGSWPRPSTMTRTRSGGSSIATPRHTRWCCTEGVQIGAEGVAGTGP
ncbi:MAG: FGGY-family carbohydrate kinase [Geodermatophilaceae bacterium]